MKTRDLIGKVSIIRLYFPPYFLFLGILGVSDGGGGSEAELKIVLNFLS